VVEEYQQLEESMIKKNFILKKKNFLKYIFTLSCRNVQSIFISLNARLAAIID
jgi:hypothetical protein